MKDHDLTAANPDLTGIDVEALNNTGAYHDGSGGGLWEFAWQEQKLREQVERIGLLRNFIRKHQNILARLSWSADSSFWMEVKGSDSSIQLPVIEMSSRVYDKRTATAQEIAKLWPAAEWRRAVARYGIDSATRRDWSAVVDGVLLIIEKAEILPAVKEVDRFGPCGRVKL